jgi:hypothetical protein
MTHAFQNPALIKSMLLANHQYFSLRAQVSRIIHFILGFQLTNVLDRFFGRADFPAG